MTETAALEAGVREHKNEVVKLLCALSLVHAKQPVPVHLKAAVRVLVKQGYAEVVKGHTVLTAKGKKFYAGSLKHSAVVSRLVA